jgi:vitamin B12 transporter
MKPFKLLVFASLFLFTASAHAQEPADTVLLDPLVVSATRLAIPASKVTASVSVIDGAELRRRGVRNLAEALRAVSGAAVVQSGSYGANTSLFLRGGESDYVQVLVDGVQVNSPGEQFNFSSLAIEDIERIEIVKGPASVLYGSDAVTGVIQLFTRQGAGAPRADIRLAGGRGDKIGSQADGSFNNGFASGELYGGNEHARYSVGASHFGTQGAYAFNNEHRNTSVTGRGSLLVAAGTRINGTARFGASRYHVPTDGSGNLADRNQFSDNDLFAVGLSTLHSFSRKLDAQLDVQFNQNDATTDDQPDDAADTLGFFRFHSDERFSRQNVDLRVNYLFGEASTFTLGSEFEKQTNRASSSSPFGIAPETTEKRNSHAAYAQLLADISRFTIQLGARAENNERFGNFMTYRGGASMRIAQSLRLRASAGTAFKEPRFFEQFAEGFVRGNPDLEPEQSRSIELGGDVLLDRVTFTASWFDQKFKDLIQYIGAPASPNDPNYLNVAGARASGLEVGTTISFGPIRLTASYTMLDTEVTDEGDGEDPSFAEGERLLRRPEHSGSLAATASFERVSVGAMASYVGARADLDFADFPANRVMLPSYTRIDFNGEYRLTSAVTGTVKLENALDESYEEVLGFPAPRRVVYLGARLSLQ